jgi:alpha-beta hydrolase superfamily lysophospholipase
MKSNQYKIPASDNTPVHVYEWFPNDGQSIRGIVQFVHGMAEHAGRYEEFASFLTNNGFLVLANDHRGHGKTAGTSDKLGVIPEGATWEDVYDDLKTVSIYARKKYPGKPFFILGHSMGSFLTRKLLTNKDYKPTGVILSGTAGNPGMLGFTGILITKIMMLYNSGNTRTKLMYKLTFETYNKVFKPNRTPYDWLTRDNAQVEKYLNDPYCGAVFSIGFFNWLLKTMMFINLRVNFETTPKDLPILLFSGTSDPVGNFGKGVNEVFKKFKKAGVKDISLKLYEGGRHEMLNEINYKEVYQLVLDWLNAKSVKEC